MIGRKARSAARRTRRGTRVRGAPVRHPALFVASECPATQEREAYDRLLVFHRDINRSVTRDHSHRIHGRRDVVKNGKARLLAHGKLGIRTRSGKTEERPAGKTDGHGGSNPSVVRLEEG